MPTLTVLTTQEVEAVHQATLRILSEVGIVLGHAEAREMLAAAGAAVRGERLHLPPELVERAVAQCPTTVSVRGRGGATATLGDGTLHWHNVGGARDVYEPRRGTRRPATVQDVRDSARLLDALTHATTVVPFFTPQDVPGPLMSLAMYRHTLPHTVKPLQGPGVHSAQEVQLAIRMASVIGPPAEVLTLSVSPVSPLTFSDPVAESMIAIARQGITFGPLPCPTAGATAPMSLAGALAQQNAEVLASVVLVQMVKPGLPVVYCGRLAMMEPRTGVSVWGGVELGLVSAATVQMGHRYRLPVNVYGFSTNSHTLEIQSGYERALNAAVPALAGADELSGIGEMAAGVMGSYAQMVCDDEIAASVARLRRGFAADEDALAVEVIAAVMDGSRNFLDQRHTVRHLRAGAVHYTHLAERRDWGEWDKSGREGMAERAQAQAERLLAEHQAPPLTPEQERELETIMAEAHDRLVS
ncbi:MAG: trimethylamine methyltransferase family protein [Chloroflexota bacterium]